MLPRLLAPVYGWFTEGFDTLDLKEAKELLDELALEVVERSFFRKPGLAQAIDNGRWGRRRFGHKPFDRELRIETARLRQSGFASMSFPFAASAPAKMA